MADKIDRSFNGTFPKFSKTLHLNHSDHTFILVIKLHPYMTFELKLTRTNRLI
jgi:hypothetical protein